MKNQTSAFVRFGVAGLAILFLVGGFSASAFAQGGNGSISGTVTDPKGLAVADANVVVKNSDTGVTTPLPTNSSGVYTAPYLQPGNYEISATKSGFETASQTMIVLHVGDKLTIDLQLPLQGQTSTITVTTEAPLVETEKTESSQTVSETQVSGLPLVTRRWENFALLTPAVTTDGNSGLSSFRGLSSLYNGNSVDGANNTQAFFSEARGRAIIVTYVYSPDSIKEFEVSASNYSAEFGQAAGGTVNAVTRSGTNDLHGDLFWNFRYPTLNALDPFGKSRGTLTQTVHQQNQFGGSVGAPIIKDKLWFFGTYDGFRKSNPILYLSTQPNAAFGPAGTTGAFACPASATALQCTNGKNFISNNLLGAFPRDLKQDVFLGKLDYQLNSSNHLSAVFNWQNWGEPDGYNTAATVTNGGVTQNGHGGTHERFFIGDWTTTFSSSIVNDLKFAWGRDFEFDSTNSGGPSASLTNIASYGETSALPRGAFPDEHRYQISDNLSTAKGSHLLKFGVDVNLIHELLINLFQGDGNYSYAASGASFDGCNNGVANATFCRWLDDVVGADVLVGGVSDGLLRKHWSTFTQVNDPITHVGKDDFYDDDFGAYFEDTWKVKPSLTLNLGVRYDLQHVPAPPQPNMGRPILNLYTATLNNDKNNIQPRLGLAWQLARNTILRVGYGIFYGKTSNSTYYALRVENGVYQQTFSGCAPATCGPAFPNVFFLPPGPAPAAPFAGALTPQVALPAGLTAASAGIHGMTPDFVNPAAHEGEVTIERQLPGRMAFSATYLVTRGLHLPASYEQNLAPATTTVTYNILANSTATSPIAFTKTVPFYTSRIDPLAGSILNQASIVNSWYNGLVLTLRKPFSHDVEFTFNYTYSHALDDGQTAGSNGTFFGTDTVLDPYNIKGDYGNSDLDTRHRFVGSIVWQPTYGKNFSNKAARQLVDGWSISSIVTSSTGQPFAANNSTPTITPPGTTGPPAGDGGTTGGVVSGFLGATGGRVPWLPRNPYNLPRYTNIDFRMGRAFTFHERYHLDFTVDAFNLFNSTIVTALNTTAYSYEGPTSGACQLAGGNGCFVPSSSFGSVSTTSGALYGARQLQFGAKFFF